MNLSRYTRTAALAAALSALLGTGVLAAPATAHPAGPAAPSPGSDHGQPEVRRLIVGYKPGTAQARSDAAVRKSIEAQPQAAGEQAVRFERRLATGAVLLDLKEPVAPGDLHKITSRLTADKDVAYAQPDATVYPMAAPDDPLYPLQWDLYEERGGMNVPDAWPLSTGKGVQVAVIDSGYATHSDLDANIVDGYDFVSDPKSARDGDGRDDNYHDPGTWRLEGYCPAPFDHAVPSSWHGTHVAGTIAAQTNNGKGVASTAYDAKVQPVRALGACGGTEADIGEALIWASGGSVPDVPDNPAPSKVVNMSLGYKAPCSPFFQDSINAAARRGVTVVVSAGNDNANASDYAPGNCTNVITVAASNRNAERAQYSNYGSRIDITAPGGKGGGIGGPDDIGSTYNQGKTDPGRETYGYLYGTSMAAPHISALAALLLQRNPNLTPAQIEQAITTTARPMPSCGSNCGAGLADAAKAVRSVRP
ncbi:S8 family peptidase [Streptomyces sp. Inha503]|uniref:S8 family peptidase n=1 Tax=Streptomyces sp. Inha503 TaxID=3383314 RepID=UPI0039A1B673